ncbi:MAG: homoserine dehydrogenase, partial [Ligilactobacillus agilis]|nr:homoserine dehydrogenase [Ligilactobacillus agilis]
MEVINIGMLGLGTVGSGVVRMLTDHAEKISLITGRKLVVKTVVVHDLTKKRSVDMTGINVTDDVTAILNDPEIG